MVWKYAPMHKNTFQPLQTLKKPHSREEKNNLLRTWFWWPGNASKHVLYHSRGEKNNFLRTWFWWYGSMRKCIKTRFYSPQTFKTNFLRTWFWWSGNASKHVFNHSRGEKIIFKGLDSGGQEMHQSTPEVIKIIFFRTLFWWSRSMRKYIKKHNLNHSRRLKIIFEGLDSDGQEMHKNTFLTTPDVKK